MSEGLSLWPCPRASNASTRTAPASVSYQPVSFQFEAAIRGKAVQKDDRFANAHVVVRERGPGFEGFRHSGQVVVSDGTLPTSSRKFVKGPCCPSPRCRDR